jgi:hypothetical protein
MPPLPFIALIGRQYLGECPLPEAVIPQPAKMESLIVAMLSMPG